MNDPHTYIVCSPVMAQLTLLGSDEVLKIYEALTTEFAESNDPISPAGIKSSHLLESALSRQHTGFGGQLKYPEPRLNAAALMYGLCLNHAFHNGNKRTALVSGLVHLQRNGFFPMQISYDEIYEVICSVADKTIGENVTIRKAARVRHNHALRPGDPDDDIFILSQWLKAKTRVLDMRERPITFRKLKPILEKYGCKFGAPQGNFIKISRTISEKKFLGFKREQVLWKSLSYSGPNFELNKRTLKEIREALRLTEQDGVDSTTFYGLEEAIDVAVLKYWSLLKRLART